MRNLSGIIAALLLTACEPPPNDEAAPGDGGVATIQQADILANVNLVEDMYIKFGLDSNTLGPAWTAPAPGMMPWYPYPNIRVSYQRYQGGHWMDWGPLETPLAVQSENVFLPAGFMCAPLIGCWHLTVQGLDATTYRSHRALPRLGPIDPYVARAYRMVCPNGHVTTPFMYGQMVNLWTQPVATRIPESYARPYDVDPQAIYTHAMTYGALADPAGWRAIAAQCGESYPGGPRYEDAFNANEYAYCGSAYTSRCNVWPGGGTCSPDWMTRCPH